MAIAKLARDSELLTKFNAFVTAAESAGKDDVFVIQSAAGDNQFALRRSAEDKIHKWSRNDSLKRANDNVRRVFKQTVLAMLGKTSVDQLDDDLRAALKLGDYDKGCPLSARRILAVNAVIQKVITLNDDAGVVQGDAADTQVKIRDSIANRRMEALFEQCSRDVRRNDGIRLTEGEQQQFRDNPYAKVDIDGGGRFFMLNGDEFPHPDSANDTSEIKKFAYSFLAGGGAFGPRHTPADNSQS